jgi:tetratricopeptide (TPR) repeat protein
MAGVQENRGRFDEAIRWTRLGMEIDPGRLSAVPDLASYHLNLGGSEGLQRIRDSLSRQDPDHYGNEFLAILEALYEENYRGAMESMPALVEKIGLQQGFQITFAFISILAGDLQEARTALQRGEPRFFDRATWDEALQFQTGTGCDVAWVLARTGDAAMGQALLSYTIDFMENQLTGYMDHADRFNFPACYAIAGDFDKAMAAIEVQVEHRHTAFWWLWTRMPYFEPLRGTPRFEAAIEKIRTLMAEQRMNLEAMGAIRS